MKKTKIKVRKHSFYYADPICTLEEAKQAAIKVISNNYDWYAFFSPNFDAREVIIHSNKFKVKDWICTLIWEEEVPVDTERVKRHNKFKYASYNKRKISCLSSKTSL